ncbi:hypothetical protein GCM10010441_54950 [Kitasatospora paracochleata]|uniref:Intracellular septation protein A n=1 Tax=Kitasatospora paracochleata TaxID=58354 RepID=A0ABT1J957_9ACTN|nr:VC0807 family protein [Kitasatospora paracochleata]MCP2313241.1 intracellular septation protein A [Kitasatospora paracochleata]
MALITTGAITTEPKAGTGQSAGSTAARTAARQGAAAALRPLAIDVAVPIGAYYVAHGVLGLGVVAALAVGSAVPMVRTVVGLVRERSVNGLALLMLVVNVVGIALSGFTGDARLAIAKDAVVSSVIGGAILVSALAGRPMMSRGMRPFVVRGDAARSAAWDRLSAGDTSFRRNERAFSLVWGGMLLAECTAKVVGAYTLPVDTMVWLGTVFLVAAIVLATVVANPFAARLGQRISTETAA